MAARSTTASPAAKKSPATKKAVPKQAATKNAVAAKKAVAKKAVAAKKTPPKKAVVKKAPAKKAVPAKKTLPKKAVVKKAVPKKAVPKKDVAKKPPFTPKFLAQQEAALQEERATYTRQAVSLRAEADSLVEDFEAGDVQFDEESGEGDTLNTERERDLALSAQAQHAVEEIEHALSKFALGTYGICEVSGDPIPKERLEAIPWARERVEYKIGGIGRR